MSWDRDKAIERLIDDTAETVTQWALSVGRQDRADLRAYVAGAEGYDKLDDDTLKNLCESTFGETIEETDHG